MIPKGYEEVLEIPPAQRRTGRKKTILLEPGQIIRRKIVGGAGVYGSSFKRRGTPDYHAAIRTVDGEKYLYIWRDPVEETI